MSKFVTDPRNQVNKTQLNPFFKVKQPDWGQSW